MTLLPTIRGYMLLDQFSCHKKFLPEGRKINRMNFIVTCIITPRLLNARKHFLDSSVVGGK